MVRARDGGWNGSSGQFCSCTGLIYGSRLSETPPGGEEPRRGQVAREMFGSGDWIVPRQQGLPFLSRPPVQNWAIALCSLAGGRSMPWRSASPASWRSS